jgi:hypothetical protein
MIKRLFILLSLTVILALTCYPQNINDDDRLRDRIRIFGQAEVTIPYTDSRSFDYLTRKVSVLSVRNKVIEISLSPITIEWFIQQKFNYIIKEKADLKGIVSAASLDQVLEWDKYPTYSQYDSIMQSFTLLYPEICHLDTIGTSVNGKLVLALKISGNRGNDESKPKVFYSSTIHGDETGGFVLMLRLADFLVKNYTNDDRVKNLINNLEIWINPVANPDGTYTTGNTISSPSRFNANGVDLNRNFPDPMDTGIVQEKETLDMMKFMRKHRFVISANFHAGAEVVNYPWDRWLNKLHADNDWFYGISRAYADTVHVYSGPGYMDDLDNGVTQGSAWYIIYGGRQDFVTQELHGREVTIELDNQHITSVSQLSVLWDNNWRSLLGYLENALYGIHGVVLNSLSSAPVPAEVFIEGHDKDSSQVYSDTLTGTFVRLLSPGSWNLKFTANGYHDAISNVVVYSGQKTDIIVNMVPETTPSDTTIPEAPSIYPNPATDVIKAILPDGVIGTVNMKIFNLQGALVLEYNTETFNGVPLLIDIRRLSPGTYLAVFRNSQKKTSCMGRFIVIK